jgi:hypothetical protein
MPGDPNASGTHRKSMMQAWSAEPKSRSDAICRDTDFASFAPDEHGIIAPARRRLRCPEIASRPGPRWFVRATLGHAVARARLAENDMDIDVRQFVEQFPCHACVDVRVVSANDQRCLLLEPSGRPHAGLYGLLR